jgi:hypothetical protein
MGGADRLRKFQPRRAQEFSIERPMLTQGRPQSNIDTPGPSVHGKPGATSSIV